MEDLSGQTCLFGEGIVVGRLLKTMPYLHDLISGWMDKRSPHIQIVSTTLTVPEDDELGRYSLGVAVRGVWVLWHGGAYLSAVWWIDECLSRIDPLTDDGRSQLGSLRDTMLVHLAVSGLIDEAP